MTSTTQLAPARTQAAAPRYDSYRGIHKALRLFMCDTLTRTGRTDPADAVEVAGTLGQLRALMDLCELHLKDENEFVHPALERVQHESAARIEGEHVEHREAIASLRDLAGYVDDTPQPEARAAALHRLYHALSRFVAENFEHMLHEETAHNAVLWAHYSDQQILDIEHQIVASIPPDLMMSALQWFIPALSAPERAAMLGGMRQAMPAPAFAGVLSIARRTLSAGDFGKLALALQLDPADAYSIS